MDERDTSMREGERPLAAALDAAVGSISQRGGASSRAGALWARAAGPLGAKHTRGVYLKEPAAEEAAAGALPVLYVYVDSPTFVFEYGTDHVLYENQLAYLGLSVERIEFRLSRMAGEPLRAYGDASFSEPSHPAGPSAREVPASLEGAAASGGPHPSGEGAAMPAAASPSEGAAPNAPAAPAPLTEADEARVEEMVRDLPPGLADAARRALRASMERGQG